MEYKLDEVSIFKLSGFLKWEEKATEGGVGDNL